MEALPGYEIPALQNRLSEGAFLHDRMEPYLLLTIFPAMEALILRQLLRS